MTDYGLTGYFLYGKGCSRDYGLYISGSGTFNAPERDVETVEVPGRNGTLVIDHGRFKNITVTYPAFIRQKFQDLAQEARAWLLEDRGYVRLTDSYDVEHYRLARFSGPLDFDMQVLNRSGECNIVFDCKPQRFLILGDQMLLAERGTQLYNPTRFPSLPLIRAHGTSGTLFVGNTVVQIKQINGYVDLDCDTQNAYKGSVNCNTKVVLQEFPQLPPGMCGINYEGMIEKVEIKPRWWTI